MKKFLSILLFGVVSTISTVSPVLAENYNYKLYNPNILYRSTGVILDTFTMNDEAQMSLFADEKVDEKKFG